MTAFANCGFEFLCAIGVFAILGFMATSQGVGVDEVVSSGVGLAFVVFPEVFSAMGAWGSILGALFFISLVFAGLTSLVSLVEAITASIIDKTGWERKKVVSGLCIVGATISSVFATGAGLYLLDIIDNFVNCYAIVGVGLLEAILIGWIVKPDIIRNHVNKISYFRIGKWWDFIVKFVTPTMLIIMLVQSLISELKSPYGGYPLSATLVYGWAIIGFGVIVALLISRKPWENKSLDKNEEDEEVVI